MKLLCKVCVLISFFSSCDPCSNVCCDSDNFTIDVRILNDSNNIDLLFGPNKIYEYNQIKFYSIVNSDTILYDFKPIFYSGDSCLTIDLFPRSEIIYLQLSSNDTDTFKLFFKSSQGKCCGNVTYIDKLIFNNEQEFNRGNSVLILYK